MGTIYCLMNHGPGLTELIRQILFDTAQEMVRRDLKRKLVRNDDFEGVVTTNKDWARMGGVSGYVFRAVVESEAGVENNVSYLVRPADLEDLEGGRWVDVSVV